MITRAISLNTLRSFVDKRRASESMGLNTKRVTADSTTSVLKMMMAVLVLTIRTANKENIKRQVDVTVHIIDDFR